MFLSEVTRLELNYKFNQLKKTLNYDHGVILTPYYDLSENELSQFINDLDVKKNDIISEYGFSDQFQNPDYVKAALLCEACKMILIEISPKRIHKTKKIQNTNETLDFKVDVASGAVIDHVTGNYPPETEIEKKQRPDLYWRRQQWRAEQENDDPTVKVIDGDNHSDYPQNHDIDTSSTEEDHQEAGVYVGIMNQNRFLGSDETSKTLFIEPSDAPGKTPEITDVTLSNNISDSNIKSSINDMELKQLVVVYEDNKKMPKMQIINELGKLLKNTLLQESELERAEVSLSLRDLANRMQKLLEDAAKMGTEDIMVTADGLRLTFGDTVSDNFSEKAELALQKYVDAIQELKDIYEKESENVAARISDEDANKPLNDLSDIDTNTEYDSNDNDSSSDSDDTIGVPDNFDDNLDKAVNHNKPFERTKKEGYKVNIQGNTFKLNEEQYNILRKARDITNKLKRISESNYKKNNSIIVNINNMRVKLTEHQINSLIFTKRFYNKTSLMGAKTVRVNNNQHNMIVNAKHIINILNDGHK